MSIYQPLVTRGSRSRLVRLPRNTHVLCALAHPQGASLSVARIHAWLEDHGTSYLATPVVRIGVSGCARNSVSKVSIPWLSERKRPTTIAATSPFRGSPRRSRAVAH